MSDEPAPCAEALSHPLRQALFILLRHHPATAPELQVIVGQPLQAVAYHLGVLAERDCLLTENDEGKTTYRLNPSAAGLLSGLGDPQDGLEQVVMMSFLDTARAKTGRPSDQAPVSRPEVHQLDEDGLLEALAVVAQALEQLRSIAELSRVRRADSPREVSPHMLVVAASLIEPASGGQGSR